MKNWIIKKLGGYTGDEVDALLAAFDKYHSKNEDSLNKVADVMSGIIAAVEFGENNKNNKVIH